MYEDGTFQKIAEKYAEYNIPEMICIERYMDGGDKSDKDNLIGKSFTEKRQSLPLLLACTEKNHNLESGVCHDSVWHDPAGALRYGRHADNFFSTLVISLPLGLLVAFARMSDIRPFRRLESNGRGARLLKKFNPIRLIMQFFISVLRGTPLMLQLIVWCYGPYYLFGIRLTPEWRIAATVLGFGINYAAYFAEIFRSGIRGFRSVRGKRPKYWDTTGCRPFLK